MKALLIACALALGLSTAAVGAPASAPMTPQPGAATAQSAACCKVCTKGKPCGDSCIARTRTCHQPPGCACRTEPRAPETEARTAPAKTRD